MATVAVVTNVNGSDFINVRWRLFLFQSKDALLKIHFPFPQNKVGLVHLLAGAVCGREDLSRIALE